MNSRRHTTLHQICLALFALSVCAAPVASADSVHVPLQIWFVTHAESAITDDAYPRSSADTGITYPLTERGMQQAAALADQLVGIAILEVYTSTRLRAVQTADAIALRHGMPIRLAPEAVEIDLDVPIATRETRSVYTNLAHHWLEDKDSDARNGEGESLADLQRRFLPFVREIMNRHADDSGGTVVIVSHSDAMGLMLPVLAPNVSSKFALAHALATGAIVKTELRDGRLYCAEWSGISAASFNDP